MNQMLQEPEVQSHHQTVETSHVPDVPERPPAPAHPAFRQAAAGRLRAVVVAPRRRRGMPPRVPRRDRGAPYHARAGRSVRGAGFVRDTPACATAGQDAALHRDRGRRPRRRRRHLSPRIRRRHRDQGADGRAAQDRGAGILGGADAAAIPRQRRASRLLPQAFRHQRASRSRKPAPTRCTAWRGCADKWRRGLCKIVSDFRPKRLKHEVAVRPGWTAGRSHNRPIVIPPPRL